MGARNPFLDSITHEDIAAIAAILNIEKQECQRRQMQSAYETVLGHYQLPFPLYLFQQDIVNELAPLPRAGYYADMGTGKTVMATVADLYKRIIGDVEQTYVIMPPILIQGWYRWLTKIPGLKVTKYVGSPAERAAIKLDGEFILMTMQIFKKDFDRLGPAICKRKVNLIVDEAHSVKNVTSGNHKTVRDASAGQALMLLTGTPITSPMDGYAFCKLIAPGTYRNLKHFENLHVAERNFFGVVTEWQNLDLLAANIKINTRRVLREEVLTDLPAVIYTPIYYELDKAHKKLYDRLAEEQFLKLESGGKIDATTASALYHALQQIILNNDYFSGNPEAESVGLSLIEQTLEELGDRKLLVFGSYRMTNTKLIARLADYNAVAVYGGNTPKENDAAVQRFKEDPTCRVVIAQPSSAGFGIDGWQDVCADALFIETPVIPREFHQGCARLHRSGQKSPVNIRIAIAEKTVQTRLHKQLLTKDTMVGDIVGNFQDLRQAIYGT